MAETSKRQQELTFPNSGFAIATLQIMTEPDGRKYLAGNATSAVNRGAHLILRKVSDRTYELLALTTGRNTKYDEESLKNLLLEEGIDCD